MSEEHSGGSQMVQDPQWSQVEQRSVVRAKQLKRAEPIRNAVPLGTIDAGAIGDVDPAGLVQMRGASWSLDWWIGAADRWHFPSLDATVVQTLVDSTPVVQTAVHVPGGEILHRAYAVRANSAANPDSGEHGQSGRWEDSAVVVEVENRGSVAVALAFAFVPLGLYGPGEISELSVEGSTVTVDGQVAGVLSRPIARRVVGPPGTTSIRLEMTDDEDPEGTWAVPDQLCEGAYVVPLPHTATVRLLLPRVSASAAGRRLRRHEAAVAPGAKWHAPTSEQVGAGWAVHTRDSASITTPEPLLASLLKVAEGHLLVASTDAFLDGDGTVPTALRNAQLCEALVSAGIDEPLGPIATALVASERFSGQLRMPDRSDAVIALIHAAAPLLVGSRSEVWTEDLIGPVAKGIHRVGQGKGVGESLELKRSAAVALARVAPSLRFVGQPEVAEAAASTARRLWESVGNTAGTPGPIAVPTAGPSGQSSLLQKAVALRASVLAGSDGAVDDLLKFARSGNLGVLGAFEDTDGNPTGELAVDPAVIATRAATVMDLLVAQGPEGPVLLPSWSPYWFDKPVEAQRIRTAWGLVSYAVRWHGNRPAILWEIEPAAGIPMVDGAPAPESAPVLKAPGLDPDWSATGWAGEALLSPVTVSEQVIAEIAERATPRLSVQLGMKPKKK